MRDFEVWIDQVVRAAATSNDSVDDAVATIESAIDRLRTLLDNPAALVLGAHAPERAGVLPGDAQAPAVGGRRRPAVAGGERLQAARPRHLPRTARRDAQRGLDADARGPRPHVGVVRRRTSRVGPTDRRRHGALANWLAAELALRWRPVEGRPELDRTEARRLIDEALTAAREEAYLAPTFWTVAVYADLRVARRALEPARHGRRGAAGPRPLPPRQRARQRGAAASGPRPGRLPPRHGRHRGAAPRRVPAAPCATASSRSTPPPEPDATEAPRAPRHRGHGHRLTAYLAYVVPPAKRR